MRLVPPPVGVTGRAVQPERERESSDMGHGLTESDAMFAVRDSTWHGLENLFADYPTRKEAQALVHGWEPQQVEMYYKWPAFNDAGEPVMEERPVKSSVLNLRDDNGDEIAAVSRTYQNVLNDEMWDVGEAIQGSGVDVKYETGGSFRGGAQVWLMLALQDPIEIKGDPRGLVLPYYLLQNAHDATGAFKGSATLVKVVCQNTFRAADLDAKARGTEWSFSHTRNIGDRIEEAKAALAGWRESIEAFRLLGEHMVNLPVSKSAERTFVEKFIPAPLSTMTSDRVKNNIETARDGWLTCYNSVTCEGTRGTAWGLLQASSEWSEHVRAAESKETRFRRTLLNRNSIISDAKRLALVAAGV